MILWRKKKNHILIKETVYLNCIGVIISDWVRNLARTVTASIGLYNTVLKRKTAQILPDSRTIWCKSARFEMMVRILDKRTLLVQHWCCSPSAPRQAQRTQRSCSAKKIGWNCPFLLGNSRSYKFPNLKIWDFSPLLCGEHERRTAAF